MKALKLLLRGLLMVLASPVWVFIAVMTVLLTVQAAVISVLEWASTGIWKQPDWPWRNT